ncbi:MAG TPA: hypothetical protein VFI55_04530 [Mycobacterium sp.]|nr:hypothetical protein [Mycobacterium sp.]
MAAKAIGWARTDPTQLADDAAREAGRGEGGQIQPTSPTMRAREVKAAGARAERPRQW